MENNTENRVVLQGVVVGKRVFSKSTVLVLAVRKNNDVTNYPRVRFNGEEAKIASTLSNRTHVKIEGKVQSVRYLKDGKRITEQNILGNHLELVEDLMSSTFNIRGGAKRYPADENEVIIRGKVRQIIPNKNSTASLIINTSDENNNVSSVKCAYYIRGKRNDSKKIKEGDEVVAIGQIQTTKKPREEGDRYFENVVLEAVTIVPDGKHRFTASTYNGGDTETSVL